MKRRAKAKTVRRRKPARRRARRNPALVVMGANPRRGELIGTTVERLTIRYKHAADGQHYYHHTQAGVRIQALPDGSLRLTHPTRRLWGEY